MTQYSNRPDREDISGEAFEPFEYVEEVVEYRDTSRLRIVLGIILAILLLLLAFVGYQVLDVTKPKGGAKNKRNAKEMVWVQSIYGWGTGESEHLVTPNSVDIAPDGTIWTNSRNRYAVAFNPDGSRDRILMSKPESTSSKEASATKPSEPEAGSGSLMMGAGSGSKVSSATPGVAAVFSLAVDEGNNLYIGDDAKGNVLKFTPEGKLEGGWSVPGLVKITASKDRIAAVGKGSVGVFAQGSGSPIFYFGTRGQGAEQFDLPLGVHIDDAGNVYVADTQNQRVRKYSPAGHLLWDAGTVPDRKNPKTHDARNAEAVKGIFELPTGVTTDANGHVVVVDAFKYKLIVLDGKTGRKLADYGDYGTEDGLFNNASAIAYDKERDYFVVADTDNNRLQVVRLPDSSPQKTQTALRRALDRPVWILCLPFLVLAIAALIASVLRRRRRSTEGAS